jgi:phytoene dehydrogenase-like protein
MQRYRLRQGKLREDDNGEWVMAAEAEERVAKLEKELERLGLEYPDQLYTGVFGMAVRRDETLLQAMQRWYEEFDNARNDAYQKVSNLRARLGEKTQQPAEEYLDRIAESVFPIIFKEHFECNPLHTPEAVNASFDVAEEFIKERDARKEMKEQ